MAHPVHAVVPLLVSQGRASGLLCCALIISCEKYDQIPVISCNLFIMADVYSIIMMHVHVIGVYVSEHGGRHIPDSSMHP